MSSTASHTFLFFSTLESLKRLTLFKFGKQVTHENLWQTVTPLELLASFTVENNGLWCRAPGHLLSEANHDSSSPLKDTVYLGLLSSA